MASCLIARTVTTRTIPVGAVRNAVALAAVMSGEAAVTVTGGTAARVATGRIDADVREGSVVTRSAPVRIVRPTTVPPRSVPGSARNA